MKKLTVLAGAVLLSACGSPDSGQAEAPTAEAETETAAEAMPLTDTSWTFTIDGKDYFETIDADGNYISNVVTDSGEQHSDHGTYEMVDGKHCFTSLMSDDGAVCWTTPATIAVGDSVDATNDAGDTLTVTRAEYKPLTM